MQMRQPLAFKEQLKAIVDIFRSRGISRLEKQCSILAIKLKTIDFETITSEDLILTAEFEYHFLRLLIFNLHLLQKKLTPPGKEKVVMSQAVAFRYHDKKEDAESGYVAHIHLCVNQANKIFSALNKITLGSKEDKAQDRLMEGMLYLNKKAQTYLSSLEPLFDKAQKHRSDISPDDLPLALVPFNTQSDETKPIEVKPSFNPLYKKIYALCHTKFKTLKLANIEINNLLAPYQGQEKKNSLNAALLFADEFGNKQLRQALTHYSKSRKKKVRSRLSHKHPELKDRPPSDSKKRNRDTFAGSGLNLFLATTGLQSMPPSTEAMPDTKPEPPAKRTRASITFLSRQQTRTLTPSDEPEKKHDFQHS